VVVRAKLSGKIFGRYGINDVTPIIAAEGVVKCDDSRLSGISSSSAPEKPFSASLFSKILKT